MTLQERETLAEKILEIAKECRVKKGPEYAVGNDILQLHESDEEIGVSKLQSVGVFMNKHYRAIRSYIKNGEVISDEKIETRIADMINYLIILYCLVENKKL